MKKSIILIASLIFSMTIIFLLCNAFVYWYECGKDMCNWALETKNMVIGFTIGSGVIVGLINGIRLIEDKTNR